MKGVKTCDLQRVKRMLVERPKLVNKSAFLIECSFSKFSDFLLPIEVMRA
jgi:hypothetical protein